MSSLARWTLKTEHRYTAFDGRLYLERRPHLSPNWTARCCHANKQLYKTTKTPTLADAQHAAEEWFIDKQTRIKRGEPVSEHTVAQAYASFIQHHEQDLVHTGASNPRKVKGYNSTWNGSVKEFFGDLRLSEVTTKKMEEFRRWRQTRAKEQRKKPLTEKSLHADIGLVRMVLKHANRQEWLKFLPQFPVEHIEHASPDWFNQDQLALLIKTSHDRMNTTKVGNAAKRIRRNRMAMHAFIWFMAHGCIRVDECLALRWKDIVPHPANDRVPPSRRQYLLHVRNLNPNGKKKGGKTGWRQGVGTLGVEVAMQYLRQLHPDAGPEDKLFDVKSFSRGFRPLLEACGLLVDEQGDERNSKTLRHTSIMLRFLHEPGISAFELSTISGNSVATLQNYYLRHLTGTHVSNRLMEKALEELGAPNKKRQEPWASPDKMRDQMLKDGAKGDDEHMGEDRETGDEPWAAGTSVKSRPNRRVVARRKKATKG